MAADCADAEWGLPPHCERLGFVSQRIAVFRCPLYILQRQINDVELLDQDLDQEEPLLQTVANGEV